MSHEGMDTHQVKVMSQYNSQCFLIRDALKKKGFINSKVHTVVSSQGRLSVLIDYFVFLVKQPSIQLCALSQFPTLCICQLYILAIKIFIKTFCLLLQISLFEIILHSGGEWDYVIFSTVISLPEYRIELNPSLGWRKKNIGFIADQHQINVALTRARKGIIIIGNNAIIWRLLTIRLKKRWKQQKWSI